MNRKGFLIFFCVLMVLSALYSGFRRNEAEPFRAERISIPEHGLSPRQLPIKGNNPARAFGTAIADAVERVLPAVVVVRTEAVQYRDRVQRDLFGFPIFRVRQQHQLEGEGSGVIIDSRGYIITSLHVLEGARQIEVVLNDGTKLPSDLVGLDKTTDLAVLKIRLEGVDYPAVEFGDSDAVRVGEVAIAIGSPFSLQSSVTVGHVSQKGRRVQILPYEDFIQTDAAINEGNSGGPLVDVDGRLIGINAAIQTDAEERGVGIAFAIPSNLAMNIAKSIIEKEVYEWLWVGAFFGEIDPLYRNSRYGSVGASVVQVWDGTSAATAGLQPGDIILEVNGIKVKNEHDINRIIYNYSVGERLRFTTLRGEKKQVLELALQEFPESPPATY